MLIGKQYIATFAVCFLAATCVVFSQPLPVFMVDPDHQLPPVDRCALFPASITSSLGTQYSFSVTEVGPRVVLVVAHDVPEGENKIRIRGNDGCCDHHPRYNDPEDPDDSADFSLCRMDEVLSNECLDNNFYFFEKVNVDTNFDLSSKQVLLSGYGCTGSPPVGNPNGNMGIKSAMVLGPATAGNFHFEIDACLCEGDSGGAAFYFPGEDISPLAGDYGRAEREVVAVNSKVCGAEKSRISSTSAAGEWFKKWVKGEAEGQKCKPRQEDCKDFPELRICGVNFTGDEEHRCGPPS